MKKVDIIDNNQIRVYSDLRDKIIEKHTWDNVTKLNGGAFIYLGNSSMVFTNDEYKKIKNCIVNETCIKFNNYIVIKPFCILNSMQKLLNCTKLRSIHYCDLYYSIFSDYEIGERMDYNNVYTGKSSNVNTSSDESKVLHVIQEFDYDGKFITKRALHTGINKEYHIAKFLYENNIEYTKLYCESNDMIDITYTHKSGKKLFSTVMKYDRYDCKHYVSIYDKDNKYCRKNNIKAFVNELLNNKGE